MFDYAAPPGATDAERKALALKILNSKNQRRLKIDQAKNKQAKFVRQQKIEKEEKKDREDDEKTAKRLEVEHLHREKQKTFMQDQKNFRQDVSGKIDKLVDGHIGEANMKDLIKSGIKEAAREIIQEDEEEEEKKKRKRQ